MDFLTWVLINGPVGAVNFMMNVFFIFCMVNPLHGEKIKQPLKFLLALLVGSTTVYLMSTFGVFFSEGKSENKISVASFLISVCCLSVSISSSVWLNFFYYTQIVPAQRDIFVWIKKNIKPVIFGVIIFENVFGLLDFTVELLNIRLDLLEFNETSTNYQNIIERNLIEHQDDVYIILISIQRFHFYSSFWVMMMSSGATVVYLCRHMQHMAAHGQSLSCPQLSSQVRVTISGIIQGFHFLSLTVWREYNFVSYNFSDKTIGHYIFSTVINVYMSATAFWLGAGQVVFKQRAADMWSRVAQWCKDLTMQPQQGAREPEDTPNLHSNLQGCEL